MICDSCAFQNPSSAKFCQECGTRMPRLSVAPGALGSAERRQLTVAFCDLARSTQLAARLDPEELREVLAAYQRTCVEVVERFEGYVAQYLGDGLLLYFGYPRAHEDDAERAVRAGLGIVEGLRGLNAELARTHRVELQVRVGIHTGPVVIGEMGGGLRRETLAMGGTTNVAARVQDVAEPDTVIMTPETRRLLRGTVETRELGTRELKGLGRVAIHEALRPTGTRGRYETLEAEPHTRLVHRHGELEELARHFARAELGHGATLLVTGEAGVGKSRLAEALRDALASHAHRWLAGGCSPYALNVPFHAVAELVERGMDLEPGELGGSTLTALEESLRHAGLELASAVPLFAALLGRGLPEGYADPELSAELQRERTLESAVRWLLSLCRLEPLVLLVEDVHWADPSSLELFARLAADCDHERVLLLLTGRPSFEGPPALLDHATTLPLERLGPEAARSMAQVVAGAVRLPAATVDAIVERADGLPLHVEEITKEVVEAGPVVERDGQLELQADGHSGAVPTTLHDSLMARLDRLSAAKSVAQVASTLGRQFSYELLVEVADAEESLLRAGLARLVEAELLFVDGRPPQAQYTFKHALIQDTAYESLLRTSRRALHHRIAHALERRAGSAQLIAHHYDRAELWGDALTAYERAARDAEAAGSFQESIALLERGVEITRELAAGREREERELAFQLRLGATLSVASGTGTDETHAAWSRARELCAAAGTPTQLATALRGLFTFHDGHSQLDTAIELGDQILALARELGDDGLLIAAYAGLGVSRFWQGRLDEATRNFDAALELYRPEEHAGLAATFGTDQAVMAYGFSGWALYWQGYTARGMARLECGAEHAATLEHRYSQAYAHMTAALGFLYWGRLEQSRGHADACNAICDRHGFGQLRGITTAASATVKACETGEDTLMDALAGLGEASTAGQRSGIPGMMWMLARIHLELGRPAEGIGIIDAALAESASGGQPFFDAQLLRMKAQFRAHSEPEAAEADLLQALEVARAQGARMPELQAAAVLAPLWRARGRADEAHALLSEALSAVPEPDELQVRGARELLARLG